MRANRIPAHEEDFATRRVDSLGKRHHLEPNAIEIPDENREMPYVRVKPVSGDETYYYRTRGDKDQIVLHFTMGYLKGDIGVLTTPDYHVSVPFVVGRDGTIYNLFYSGFWSYHLGKGAVGGNSARSAASIGIELSNIGPLVRRDDRLTSVYDDEDTYCTIDDADLYTSLPFRDFEHYATFSEAQYDALVDLLRYLTARYDIARALLPAEDRFETLSDVPDFEGIVSHVNYRGTGKVDIGPVFDWDRVQAGLTD